MVGAIADDPAVMAMGETPGPERVADVDVMMTGNQRERLRYE